MPLEPSRIRAICFDVDGTLRDTDDQYVARLSGLLGRAGFLFRKRDPAAAARRMIMTIEDPGNMALYMADRMGLDNLLTRVVNRMRLGGGIDQAPARRIHLPGHGGPVIPGVRELLEALRGRFPMAIVSARPEHSTMAFLDDNMLTPYFAAIVTGQTTRYTKPFPDPVLWAASQMGVPPSACIMVGDTTPDIRAGRAAGTQTVGVLCGFGDEMELRRAGADLILPSTADLLSILLEDPAEDSPPAS